MPRLRAERAFLASDGSRHPTAALATRHSIVLRDTEAALLALGQDDADLAGIPLVRRAVAAVARRFALRERPPLGPALPERLALPAPERAGPPTPRADGGRDAG